MGAGRAVSAHERSTDDTYSAVAAIDDTRRRPYRNSTNLGEAANWNRTVSLCRGPLVKLLCSDDVLDAECVEKMSRLFSHPNVGMVFSRRTILGNQSRVESYGSAHTRFGKLHEVN